MVRFQFCNPTDIRFGKGEIAALDGLVPKDAKVLLLFGGGSIKSNGVYDAVIAALEGRTVVEFGGVEPNPIYETLQRAAATGHAAGVDLVLGVGGGSVIDAAKFLAAMLASDDEDPWDDLAAGRYPAAIPPIGAVLTLPATGSESNAVSVITHRGRRLKVPFANQAARPRFAILDPGTMRSLDRRQLQNGTVDAFVHVLEQYLTAPANTPIQYGYSEAILETLIEWGPRLLEDLSDEACENVMWAANQALNGLIGSGVAQDWSTHMIGHAITALYDVDHARSLTMVMPALLRYKVDDKREMLARYGRRVWKLSGTDEEVAAEAIARTEAFMKTMGCPVRISDELASLDVEEIVAHLERAGQTALGEAGDIRPDNVREILARAA